MIWQVEWGDEVVFGFEFAALAADALENWLDRWRTSDEGTEVPR